MAESIQLPRLPFGQSRLLTTPPVLRLLQAERPISRVRTAGGDEAWLVTRYSEVRQLLGDERLGRPRRAPDDAASHFSGLSDRYVPEMEDHTARRQLLQPFFSPKRMRALRGKVDALAGELVSALAARTPPADMHELVSQPLPLLVICELLGVPYDDRDQFRAWTQAIADMTDPSRSQAAMGSLIGYMGALAKRKRDEPADDVISGLCGGGDDDSVAFLSAVLLFAGHETSTLCIDLGAVLLLSNPSQRQVLLDRPQVIEDAVEELLRASFTGGGGIRRYALTDIDIGGVMIRDGDAVLLDLGAGNQDGREFNDPGRLDFTSPRSPHLSFGYGARYCIGAPLARIELGAVFAPLVKRLPAMRLAEPVEELQVRAGLLTRGLAELRVTW
jgi:cytochrome P450